MQYETAVAAVDLFQASETLDIQLLPAVSTHGKYDETVESRWKPRKKERGREESKKGKESKKERKKRKE